MSSLRLAQLAAARANARANKRQRVVHTEAIVAPRSPIPAPPEPGPLPPVIPPAPPGAAMDADEEDEESDADDDAIPQSPSSPVATLRSDVIAPTRNKNKRKNASATTSGDAAMGPPISFDDLAPDDALLIDSSKAASADEVSDDDGDSAYDMSVYGFDMR